MDQPQLNWIANFIWGIADDVLRDHFGEPEDLVGAVVWLCSPAARFVTGVVMPVDGGYGAFGGV
jgi:NAD(P)-dependent dehydrogenase (short-subunit alcohol dehydrogenase family)